MKISREVKEKLKSEIKEEIIEQLSKAKIRLDHRQFEDMVVRVQSAIVKPKLDSTEIVSDLLKDIKSTEEEKRIDFYRDQVFTPEIKSALSQQVLDQIEIPKDGEKGDKGDQGDIGESPQPVPLTDRDKKEIANLIDVTKLIKDRKKDLVALVEQLKTGKIKLPSWSGIDSKEIIAEFNKIIGHEHWQDRGLTIGNDGSEIATRPEENYTTDDNLDVTSTDNPGEDRVDTVISISDDPNFNSILYNENAGDPPSEIAARTWWNKPELALNIASGIGPVLQVGQEVYILIYNDTGDEIANGTTLRPLAAVLVGDLTVPTVEFAKADVFSTVEGTIMMATMAIPNGEVGLATRFGRVRGINTDGLTPGDAVFVSATTAGGYTTTEPEFPNYAISIGGILVADVSDGEIIISVTRDIFDTVNNFWNGTFRETINFEISTVDDTVIGILEPSNGHPDMTMMFSDGFTMLDTSPPVTIELTPGTASNPQENFVYIPKATKVLTVSTSGWPTAEHIKVANTILRTAAITNTDGELANRNWNDHIEDTTTFQGHLSHICEKIRQFEAQWDSGVQGSATIDTGPSPNDVFVANTAGFVYQLHKHPFPALDTQVSDDVHIVNHFVDPFLTVTNLNGQVNDALGVSLSNSSFSFVMWGIQNRAGCPSHLMINLPVGNYSRLSPESAVSDAFNFSVYDIDNKFQGFAFLIARFTFTLDATGQLWTLFDTEDLRGKIPNTTAGGGAGGTGVTTWPGLSDTPNTLLAQQIPRANAGATALDFTTLLKSGATQIAAGAAAGEFWRTASHATLPDNVILQGV